MTNIKIQNFFGQDSHRSHLYKCSRCLLESSCLYNSQVAHSKLSKSYKRNFFCTGMTNELTVTEKYTRLKCISISSKEHDYQKRKYPYKII